MSVENFGTLNDMTEGFFRDEIPENCFYCSNPLGNLVACWQGKFLLALHPECGVSFGARIIRDSLNAQYISEGRGPVVGIAPAALGEE